MHPILFSLHLSVSLCRALVVLTALISAAVVAREARRATGRSGVIVAGLQAAGLIAVGLLVVARFLTPERFAGDIVIDIRGFGVFGVLTLVLAFAIQKALGRALGLNGDRLLSVWIYGGFGGLFGARALHVAVNWESYSANPLAVLAFWDGGLVYVGGALGSLLAAVIYARVERLPFALLDVLALSVAMTQGIGRIGCFLAGCCFGRETTLPVGVQFGEGSIALYAMKLSGALPETATLTPPLHPTQLYEAAFCLVLGLWLFFRYVRQRPSPGALVATYFVFYSAGRFFLELLRNDPDRQFVVRYPEAAPLFLSTSQAAGLLLIAASIAFLVWRRNEVALVRAPRESA